MILFQKGLKIHSCILFAEVIDAGSTIDYFKNLTTPQGIKKTNITQDGVDYLVTGEHKNELMNFLLSKCSETGAVLNTSEMIGLDSPQTKKVLVQIFFVEKGLTAGRHI